jgi:hypothetical protein
MAYDMLHSDQSQLDNDLNGLCGDSQVTQQQHAQHLLNAITREKARGVRLKLPSDSLVKSDGKENKLEETPRYPKVKEADLSRQEEDLCTAQNQLRHQMEPDKAFQHLGDRFVDRFKESGAVLGLSDFSVASRNQTMATLRGLTTLARYWTLIIQNPELNP